MIIGVPKERKEFEGRVGLDPVFVGKLVKGGHSVLVEKDAGVASGWEDRMYAASGAYILGQEEVWEASNLIVKVKEPQESEFSLFHSGLSVMAFFHFAGNPGLKEKCEKIIPIPYEDIQLSDGSRPILKPMSCVAGEMAIFQGAHLLKGLRGGKGMLLSDARIAIIGVLGAVGRRIFDLARNMHVRKIFGLDIRYDTSLPPREMDFYIATPETITEAISQSDLIIGAAAVKGAGAPKLITREMMAKVAPGSVFIDVSIDEGGISETSRPTTHLDPTYIWNGVVHCCIANWPGIVPKTSSPLLTKAVFPYVEKFIKGDTVFIH